MPSLLSIQVGTPANYGRAGATDPHDKPWSTGFFKTAVTGPVELDWLNLEGDAQADLENHGGRDKAICAYAAAHYAGWRALLNLPKLPHGAFGENFTLADADEDDVCLGDEYAIGTARIQVSQPRQPCWKLGRRWRIKELPALVIDNGRTGWYFRVLLPGIVEEGQELRLLSRPLPEWPIARANQVMYRLKKDATATAELAGVPLLAESWRDALESRANMLRSAMEDES